jgi:heme-degrading monooxygenase HmoA
MPVLSTIEVTLRDEEAEKRFLDAFVKAAGHASGKVPGLLELKAFKSLLAERTYLALTLWESEAHIEAWMVGHQEQEYIRMGKEHLMQAATIRRFAQEGPDRVWARE